MKKILILFTAITIGILNSYSQDSLRVTISSKILSGGEDGYLHLKITDTVNNTVMYDSLAFVTALSGFKDTVYLDSGVYKCEILQQDIDVDLPKLTLSTGEYPKLIDNYFLFSFPGTSSLIQSNDSIRININTTIFSGDSDEWIHLRISDTITGEIWYDRNVTVTVLNGFNDSVYLDSGIYKCEILDMGVNVAMPTIILDNGTNAVWGYPDYEYYLFSLPSAISSVVSKDSIIICINTEIFSGDSDEWIHLRISDTLTGEIWYDRNVSVNLLNGFKDSIYLDSGIYKCEILDMGANVAMPTIILDNGTNAVWGYPDYEYFLFSLPSVVSSVHANLLKFKLNIFPNPFVDKIIIESEQRVKSYKIIDIHGKTIKAKKDLNDYDVTIEFDTVNHGIYFIQYQIDNKVYTEKVIKN